MKWIFGSAYSWGRRLAGAAILLIVLVGTGWWVWRHLSGPPSSPVPEFAFVEVSTSAGIEFKHFGGTRSSQLPEDMGSGAAWIDYNEDGWPDLFVTNIAGPLTASREEIRSSSAHCALYRNEGDGSFTDVSEQTGLDVRGLINGVARADFDNDGWPDLFLSAYGENRLFRNRGNGRFEEVTRESGLGNREGYWTGASWGDYNRDGWVDLYVTGYVRYGQGNASGARARRGIEITKRLNPYAYPPHRNLLFRNEGDGTFTEVAKEAGVRNETGKGLGLTWADLTGDGWPDLYVANDVGENALFRNEGDGTFKEIGRLAGVADYRGSMGLAVGDFEHDQDLDFYISHWVGEENAFYVNLGRPSAGASGYRTVVQFIDQANRYGLGSLTRDYVGWGTSFFDYDNDQNLDLFVTNGSTRQREENPRLLVPQPDMLFWKSSRSEHYFNAAQAHGDSSEIFRTATGEVLEPQVGRGAAFADYDRDGDVDIFVVNHDGSGWLLRNEQHTGNHWFGLRLEGRASNRSAIGARVQVHVDSTVQTREVGAQSSYLSQNSLVQHFGLGEHSVMDSVEITWPAGRRQVLRDVSADTVLTVRELEK